MANQTGRVSIAFSLTIGVIIIIAATVVIVCYWWFLAEYRAELVFTVSVMVAGAAIHSTYYLAASVQAQVVGAERAEAARLEDRSIAQHDNRLVNAYRMLDKLNEQFSVDVRAFIEEHVPDGLGQDDIYNKIRNNRDLRQKVGSLLGFLEDVSLAIQDRHVPEMTMYRSLEFIVTYYFEKLRGYVVEARKQGRCQALYKELERLADRWKDGHSLLDGSKLV